MHRTVRRLVVFAACLLPLVWLVGLVISDQLGPDPAAELAKKTGEIALILLLLTLSATPLQRFTAMRAVQHRRMLGLFAFFYACLHLLVFLTFLLRWDFYILASEIAQRPYITVGMLALLLMLPLAATSTASLRRQLGKRWKALHRLIYLVAVLGIVHVWWQVRSDMAEAIVYALLFGALMLARLPKIRKINRHP